MSFAFNVLTDVVDGAGTYQGDLASSYSAAVGAYLQTEEGADFAAFLSFDVNGLAVQDALAVKEALLAGDFLLSGLFGAAQSKTGEVDGELITDPIPLLTVGTIHIDLSAMLAGTDTATWETLTSKGDTIYHTREFYIGSETPEGYTEDWAVVVENQPPTADPIVVALTEYDEHAQALADPVPEQVDLLADANATDPDGDVMSVVAASVQLVGGGSLPDWISYADGVLTIDRNHADLDALHMGDEWDVDIEYEITDGNGHTITNTVAITITGTADQFTGTADAGASVTTFNNTTTWDGTFSFTLAAPAGAFDFEGTASVSVTGDIDNNAADNANDEVVAVTLEGASAVTLGAWDTPPNQEGSSDYSTQSGGSGFTSADATVDVTFDANTAGGVNGVDGLSLVAVSVTADYTYWL